MCRGADPPPGSQTGSQRLPLKPMQSEPPLADPFSQPRTTPAVFGLRKRSPPIPPSSYALDEGTEQHPGCALSAGQALPSAAPVRGCAERTQLTICDQLAFLFAPRRLGIPTDLIGIRVDSCTEYSVLGAVAGLAVGAWRSAQ